MHAMLGRLFMPVVTAVISAAALLIGRTIIFRIINRWAERTSTKIDDLVLSSIRWPSVLWAVALGIYIGIAFSELPERYVFSLTRIIHVTLILSVTFATANLSGRIFQNYIRQSSLPLPTTGLAYGLLKGIIIIIGILITLGVLGLSVTPLITALGVGGLAVALALQDTLANLFAGIHILVEKSIRVGDFIKLETGQEGHVQDITWRTTRVRMLPNNMVVIPNSKLAQSVVTNYYLPEKRMALPIAISVSYEADPEQVESILVEEARKGAADIPGLLSDPKPFVRFIPGFGENSLDFTLICQVAEFTDQFLAQHELRKRIFRRFKSAGIEIPFPQRTVHIHHEQK